jgi:rRNA maturation RNase YbeY
MADISLNDSRSESSGARKDVGLDIRNFTRRPLLSRRRVILLIANEILPRWNISLVFVGPTRARVLNERLRGKSYVPNVLSYVVGEKISEIIICANEVRKQAPAYGMSARAFALYLFIHGALHIKGWVHSDKMEERARSLLAKFAKGIARPLSNEPTNRNGHRHRHVPGKDGRRRRTR